MWFSRRSSKSNDGHKDRHNKPIATNTKKEVSCCSKGILQRVNKNQNEDLESTRITEVINYKNNKSHDAGSLIEQKPRNQV